MSAIISEIPTVQVIGSAEAVVGASLEEVMDLTGLIAQVKSLDSSDLFKLMKTMLVEAEKKSKSIGKPVKAAKAVAKKSGSQPKGVVPTQLRLPKAWVSFVKEYCTENGWDSFVVSTTKKDKVTGEKITEVITHPASELHEGVYVFEGSVTAAQPKGKTLIPKDAMSLSKQMWSAKEKTGTHEAVYNEFLASYTDTIAEVKVEAEVEAQPVKAVVVRKTAAEKELEAAEKKNAVAKEKLEKAQLKAAEKQKKDNEKAAAKQRKEEAKKQKEASPKSAKPVKAAKPATEATPVKEVKEVKVPAAPKKPAAAKKVIEKAWTCPADGAVYPWTFKGAKYVRNSDNQVWEAENETDAGDWAGVYDPATDSIDDSAEEPLFD